jgi:hypothetical protein
MTKTTMSVEVEVDLEDFSDDELVEELLLRGLVSQREASSILGNGEPKEDYMEMARAEARRGRPEEARIYLERALGRDFAGVFV